jgi:hypothetical protein
LHRLLQFPAISIPTGIAGHVAQHITLSGDGGACPPPGHPNQSCEQIMLTKDGGLSYEITKQIPKGTSGNFNGYGDLGSWVPPKKGAVATKGEFKAIVGCNDCSNPGGSLTEPTFLQTWMDDGTTLKLTKNQTITYKQTPAALTGHCAYGKGGPCAMSTPDQSIVRMKNGELLMAMYGHAADGHKNGSLYTTVFYSSADDGLTWTYASRVDVTDAMVASPKGAGEGPCEPTMATLADGRTLAAFRLEGGHPVWLSYTSDNGKTWSEPTPAKGTQVGLSPASACICCAFHRWHCPSIEPFAPSHSLCLRMELRNLQAPGSPGSAATPYAVWPQLLVLSNGALVLASGRPGIGFWVSPHADGAWN